MNEPMPWESLNIPDPGKLTRRKVKSNEKFEIFWVLDDVGSKGVLIQVDESVDAEVIIKSQLKLKGMTFTLINDEKRRLLIKLKNNEYSAIFHRFCLDLCDITHGCKSEKQIFSSLKNRINSWKKLLANSNGDLLSDIEKQGLYTELKFVKLCLQKKKWSEIEVIDSWKGPEKSQHDFVLGDFAIEIKSITNSSRNKVLISSEDQLFTKLNKLFLRVYFLTVHKDGRVGESLNSLVSDILSYIDTPQNKEQFESKLLESKYINIPENNLPSFKVKEFTDYEISDEFPKIIPSNLIEGVLDVRYKINLAVTEKFEVIEERLWEGI